MKKTHLPFRLLSLWLALTLPWGFATPAGAAAGGPARVNILADGLTLEVRPHAGVGYMEQVLQRLVAEDTYPIQGSTCQTNSSGKLPLEEPWIHATGSIVEVGDNIATWNICGFSPAILDPNAPQNLEELQAADPKEAGPAVQI